MTDTLGIHFRVGRPGLFALRASGGYYAHLVRDSSRVALCGFTPSNPRGSQFRRGRWIGNGDNYTVCPRCAVKVQQGEKP